MDTRTSASIQEALFCLIWEWEYLLREMHRLEKIYDLEATDLARGRLQNKQHE